MTRFWHTCLVTASAGALSLQLSACGTPAKAPGSSGRPHPAARPRLAPHGARPGLPRNTRSRVPHRTVRRVSRLGSLGLPSWLGARPRPSGPGAASRATGTGFHAGLGKSLVHPRPESARQVAAPSVDTSPGRHAAALGKFHAPANHRIESPLSTPADLRNVPTYKGLIPMNHYLLGYRPVGRLANGKVAWGRLGPSLVVVQAADGSVVGAAWRGRQGTLWRTRVRLARDRGRKRALIGLETFVRANPARAAALPVPAAHRLPSGVRALALGNRKLAVLVDSHEHIIGLEARFPVALGWRPWFDQAPPSGRMAKVRTEPYTQTLFFVDPRSLH